MDYIDDENLTSHNFVSADIPFQDWKTNITFFFECVICGLVVQIHPNNKRIYCRDEQNLTCEEMIIKSVIE